MQGHVQAACTHTRTLRTTEEFQVRQMRVCLECGRTLEQLQTRGNSIGLEPVTFSLQGDKCCPQRHWAKTSVPSLTFRPDVAFCTVSSQQEGPRFHPQVRSPGSDPGFDPWVRSSVALLCVPPGSLRVSLRTANSKLAAGVCLRMVVCFSM